MKLTIQDIANMAGVSKSTVSRYLNNGYVSKENIEKIANVIDKTGYKTNFFAKRLKSKNSKLIGIIIPRIDSFTASKTLQGISGKLEKEGYQPIILTSDLDKEKEISYIKKLYLEGMDGIIVMAFCISEEHVQLINKLPIPIIFTGQSQYGVNCITIDDYKAGKIMGNFVKEKGHKNIVYVGVTEEDKAVGIYRKKGFFDAFENKCNIKYIETDFTLKNAYENAHKAVVFKPSIIVGATDNIAIGINRYLMEKGIKVPQDISIAGFGDYDIGTAIYPALTTVGFDYEFLGFEAATRMLSLIRNEELLDLEEVPIKLVERQSVKNILVKDEK
ncbi:MAG: LacI family DNA-binding transcriptional regulator [Clostridium perfringens]|nr:LacI family DNA-binding transcriptional regulator [Clostridium perfringens]